MVESTAFQEINNIENRKTLIDKGIQDTMDQKENQLINKR